MSGPILIWGAGAIGGTLGAALVRAGEDVLFVDRAADHVAAHERAGASDHRPGRSIPRAGAAVTPDGCERHLRADLALREGA